MVSLSLSMASLYMSMVYLSIQSEYGFVISVYGFNYIFQMASSGSSHKAMSILVRKSLCGLFKAKKYMWLIFKKLGVWCLFSKSFEFI